MPDIRVALVEETREQIIADEKAANNLLPHCNEQWDITLYYTLPQPEHELCASSKAGERKNEHGNRGQNTAMTGPQKTVLIVEDNPLNMKLFEQILLQGGYQPVSSADGLDLVDLVAAHKPSCILMDIQLPQVSGFDLIKDIRADKAVRAIPVVAVSAFAAAHERERFLGARL